MQEFGEIIRSIAKIDVKLIAINVFRHDVDRLQMAFFRDLIHCNETQRKKDESNK